MAAPSDDLVLVRRAQSGEVVAFEELYHRESGHVFALCVRMCGDRVRATELTQDVFVRAWERLSQFRGESAVGTWLHRMTVNVVLEAVRSQRRREARVSLADDDATDAATVEPMAERGFTPASDVGQAIDLERAIASLPNGARTVFVLHDVEGYRHPEIAQMTGLAEGTLRAQLHRARRLLMERLNR